MTAELWLLPGMTSPLLLAPWRVRTLGADVLTVEAVVSGLFIRESDHDQRQRSLRSTAVTERAGLECPARSGTAPAESVAIIASTCR